MADDNLLATLEQSLRSTRMTRNRLAARLADLELEAEKLRTEIGEMDAIASQTQAAMYRILSSVLTRSAPAQPTDTEIEFALRHDEAMAAQSAPQPPLTRPQPAAYPTATRQALPPIRSDIEVKSDRFNDRTIPQATALILREAGAPLHVNEIYNRLLEGGFNFTGHHPTISIAVSLNRNRRFRKVAPGTFDLTIRDAAQAS
ncbi:MAG TPA: hypothetical protein VM864_11445 [Pyrinomonadaceae bacterium]|jgi:hypothetical protein|nr:hypothetical protein [Pyrinomonadaceae bacterium]